MHQRATIILSGLAFAILWGSASTATKFGLTSAQPFVIAISRFAIAAFVMLVLAHGILRYRFPSTTDWRKLFWYGLLNVGVYLGLYVLALQYVSAGLAALLVATNPLIITLISAVWLKHPIAKKTLIALLICLLGVIVVSAPLIDAGLTTIEGILLLLASMLSYSIGAIYFTKTAWGDLHMLVINGWQTLFGGLLVLPLCIYFYNPLANSLDTTFWLSTVWLAIPVSITAVLLWQFLLKNDPVKASFWLFLCPVAGFIIASVLLGEPVTILTLIGVVLVVLGLFIVQKRRT